MMTDEQKRAQKIASKVLSEIVPVQSLYRHSSPGNALLKAIVEIERLAEMLSNAETALKLAIPHLSHVADSPPASPFQCGNLCPKCSAMAFVKVMEGKS